MSDASEANMGIFEQISELIGGSKTPQHIKYNCRQAFEDINLTGKNVLDIGAGEGILCAYATQFAKHVTAIEPEAAGSTEGYSSIIKRMNAGLDVPNFEIFQDIVQNYDCRARKYDIVLMHNSINHLDEPMCEQLHHSSEAKNVYRTNFNHIASMMSPMAKLIISDCSRCNFFQMIHVKHPITPQIEWEKHQTPKTWVNILEPLGFTKEKLSWTVAYPLRRFSQLLSNRIAAFFLFSHFRLVLSHNAENAVLTR